MRTATNFATQLTAPATQNRQVLDVAQARLQEGRVALAMDELVEDLRARREEEPEDWPAYARACQNHPIRELLHQDPFTYWAFSKPRGYAGDAVMMDYIYGLGEAKQAEQEATPLGRALFQAIGANPSVRAVRYRRQLIAGLIDRMAARANPSVLALAAGHLREVEISRAMRAGCVRSYVAFDQDQASLAVIDHDYAHLGVQTIHGSVRHLLAGQSLPGQFDFVYAVGLFDYLPGPAAAALANRMFQMTRPGGLMLIPNFLTGIRDAGYMEAFMDWHLIYRNHANMKYLAASLPAGEVEDYWIFDDHDETITYLMVAKERDWSKETQQ